MKHKAEIVEIFNSPQGEGVYVGERMTFVRFQRCNMRCKYCDTPQGLCHHEVCRVESPAGSENFIEIPNPVSAAKLCDLLSVFNDKILSVTGGEPLEQVDFLSEWLPSQTSMNKILLETNGIQHERVERILPYINVVSMDIKLPSSTGGEPKWDDHSAFLRNVLASGIEIYVKLVVTADTTDQDIEESIRIITKVNRFIPTIIQPASQTLLFHDRISQKRLGSFERLCSAYLKDVRVIPQMHKEWGVL
ncbi:MAG: 7-carboxy-7-deazaguanine synthase QueE [Deltaproteobacteria bacterium]|jgi:7-carboxy-7-deazaguanine synthase|nr:7-carboxy-7-deazaguanine synthase QueE [Deltaproteobacteria bacterium]